MSVLLAFNFCSVHRCCEVALLYLQLRGILFTYSTRLKASSNKNKKVKVQVSASRQAYMDSLDKAVEEDRLHHGKKPLAPPSKAPATREINQSTTDPGSGYMVRDEKPKGSFYLDHRTVDGKCSII